MKNNNRILVINPGSTSTKIAVFDNMESHYEETFYHEVSDLDQLDSIPQQVEFRKDVIKNALNKANISLDSINLIMARGGLLKPLKSGIYKVNSKMIYDLTTNKRQHASNLAALIGNEIALEFNIEAFIADPVVVDELSDKARISGHPKFDRKSIFHALNTKAIARKHALSIKQNYEDLNLILVHLGGGITVGAHKKGQVVDVNQGLDGNGPFSPERSGSLPVGDLVKLCFEGNYSETEIQKMIVGNGGVSAYLNTNDMRKVDEMVENGDPKAKLIVDAMVYQISKEIGAMSVVLNGKIDGIILTGGVAYSSYITKEIKSLTSFLGPIFIYPGENEMEALASNGLRIINKTENPKEYL